MITIFLIGLVWGALSLLVGGLFYDGHRGDKEMGVADTQGRDEGGC